MVYASCLKHNEFPGIWSSLWIVLGFPVVPSLIVSNSLLPMDSTMSALPVFHHLFAQTHAHWVGDATQSSHPLSSPSSPALSLSQHQVAKVSAIQHQCFQWIVRIDFLRINWFDFLGVQGTLKRILQHHSSKASILQHSAFSLWSNSHICTWLLENHSFDCMDLCQQSDVSAF